MKLKLNDILLILVVACVGFMLVQHFIHLSDFKSLIKEKEEEIIRKTQEQNQIIEHYESKIQQIHTEIDSIDRVDYSHDAIDSLFTKYFEGEM